MVSEVETCAKPEKKPGSKPLPLPLGIKLKARNLYLVQSLPYAEIAHQTGLSVQSLSSLAHREGWTKQRRARAAQITNRADARANRELDSINDAIASECEEIALQGLTRAKEESVSKGKFAARNFQSWTGGVSNLVKVQRAARGLDSRETGAQGNGNSLQLFFLNAQPAQIAARTEKPVTEICAGVETAPALPAPTSNTNELPAQSQ